MYPHSHQANIRDRRGGQPPLGPQHLMGLPQQGPGVLMSMPNQPLHIMTPQNQQHQYNNQQPTGTFSPQSNTGYLSQPPQGPYNHTNPQVVLTKQAVNPNKHYRNMVSNQPQKQQQPNQVYANEYTNNYQAANFGPQATTYENEDSCPSHYNESVSSSQNLPTSSEMEASKELKVDGEGDCAVSSTTSALKPTKEKTPMCLVNELARFNKISHQYRLTHEEGPAHEKRFTVTLTLGNEEYTADGPSIKKAQHSAAAEALKKTSYQQPVPKAKNNYVSRNNITPTVELNALAMKRGEPAVYKVLETQSGPAQQAYPVRRPYGRGGRLTYKGTFPTNIHYTVSLKVGTYEFFGEGNTPQAARHDAASKALGQLRHLPIPESAGGDGSVDNSSDADDSLIKSPISLVHEITLKRNLNVNFEVVSEKGPPHMKVFVTKCSVGEIETTGEGNGKKVSKKRAAEAMLEELKKLPPLSPSIQLASQLSRLKRKPAVVKKKSRNLIKIIQDNKVEPPITEEINPISKLIQIQQVKKEKEPAYTLIEEKGVQRRREFVMEVSVGHFKATGSGRNKKLAKKAAAQNLLQTMGYTKADTPAKNLKQDGTTQEVPKERKVTFVDGTESTMPGGTSGRQLVPGLLLMSEQTFAKSSNANIQTTATIAKELLKGGTSPTADVIRQQSSSSATPSQSHVFRPKDQLLYLAELLKFQVHFSDFPKGNHSEYLSLVSLSTDPPQVCHGSGASIEESHDKAASIALRALSEMGLDSVTASNDSQKKGNVSTGGAAVKK